MANIKISELASATVLGGAELVELVQSGSNVQSTINSIRNFIPTFALTASNVTSSIINVPNGVAGLDSNGNLNAGVILLQDTFANLSSVVPYSGELVYATDTDKLYVGDGTSSVATLPMINILNSNGNIVFNGNIWNTASISNIINSNFIGTNAGQGIASGSNNSNFFGFGAGSGSGAVNDSHFFGRLAGANASNINNTICIGNSAGQAASSSYGAVFLGQAAGQAAIASPYTIAIGAGAGTLAYSSSSIFIGNTAGSAGGQGYSASYAIMIGGGVGYRSRGCDSAIFIGRSVGSGNQLTNLALNASSICIGDYSSTGNFANSIAIGRGTKNSAVSQSNVGNVLFINGIYSNGSSISSDAPITTAKVGIGTTGSFHTLEAVGTFCHIPASGSSNVILPYTGSMEFCLTSNNTLLISVKGYDGVIRSGSITLV